MTIKVLFFGQLTDVVGKNRMDINNVKDIASLKQYLTETYPELTNYNFLFSVNQVIIKGNQSLNEGDEVALLPPFAGG